MAAAADRDESGGTADVVACLRRAANFVPRALLERSAVNSYTEASIFVYHGVGDPNARVIKYTEDLNGGLSPETLGERAADYISLHIDQTFGSELPRVYHLELFEVGWDYSSGSKIFNMYADLRATPVKP